MSAVGRIAENICSQIASVVAWSIVSVSQGDGLRLRLLILPTGYGLRVPFFLNSAQE
jgi:hypothetical protein